ncbi:hypothetical protein EBB79_22025 (plasmid) [Parasedimentitalea marina]|uniref:Uncharacterized protein n=1 Tax=Parasedimentitalea marina TaxID=2483033 RepID=A0A3T0N9C9_9RHOB|nr:hypothetical protein [Parasedimentitalea marina]AZV80640.1 hypothetical protein EBB79_22025 [Parasedimentitalea marina]
MRYVSNLLTAGLGLLCYLVTAGAVLALNADPAFQHNSNAVWFENWTGLSNATLIISAPNGKRTEIFVAAGTPVYELERGVVLDGNYHYELRAATDEQIEIANPIDNGREEIASSKAKPFYKDGTFVVSRGVIITPEEINED